MDKSSKFDIFKTLQNQNKEKVVTQMLSSKKTELVHIPYNQIRIESYDIYEINMDEVKELATSISTIGLEQNLVVKESEKEDEYNLVTGHKRMTAIKYILDNDVEITEEIRQNIENPLCMVIPKDEDEIVTRFRMHETNQQQRNGFTVAEIEDYLKIVELAKKENITINGKKIVGTSRALLNTRFGMSEAMAKKYIKIVKAGNQELNKMVDDGKISVNKAYKMLQDEENKEKNQKENENNKHIKQYAIEQFRKDIIKSYKSLSDISQHLTKDADFVEDVINNQPIDKKIHELLQKTSDSLTELIVFIDTYTSEKDG